MMLKINLIEVPKDSLDQPQVIELGSVTVASPARFRVGRLKRECDLVLQSGFVSKRHFDLIAGVDGWSVVDNASRAGTKLNGARIQPHVAYPLHHGDNIRFCGYHFVVETDESSSKTGGQDGVPVIKDPQDSSGNDSIVDKPTQGGSQLSAADASKLPLLFEMLRELRQPIEAEQQIQGLIDRVFMLLPQGRRCSIRVNAQPNLADGYSLVVTRAGTVPVPEVGVRFSIMEQVINRQKNVISGDRQVLCVPLSSREDVTLGCLQLESLSAEELFSESALELLFYAGVLIAFAIESGLSQSARERDRKQRQDLELARQIQRSLLPAAEDCIGDYEFFAHYEAAQQVGGDYYDFVELPNGLLAMALGDVSGKGVPASLMMAKISSEIRLLLDLGLGPAAVLRRVNQRMVERHAGTNFVTLALLTVDLQDNRLTLANAGHLKPLLRLGDGQVQELGHDEAQFPLGVDTTEEYREFVAEFPEDAILMLFSDGATDARQGDECFGLERLKQALGQAGDSANDAGHAIIGAIQGFLAGRPNQDDLCLACLRRAPRSYSTVS